MAAPRTLVIDWSGRRGAGQRRALWLSEACDGALVRLEGGRTRAELVELLVEEAERDPHLVVGIDFAFSVPDWYLEQQRLTPRSLWSTLAAEGLTPRMRELGLPAWMSQPDPPFWTTGKASAELDGRPEFRRTELDHRAAGVQPKSVFQLVGAGQVGRASLYGMQALDRLAHAGFHVWPFEPAGFPLVVEIFPRVLTGAVVKSRKAARLAYLDARGIGNPSAAASEDAFDAAISAIAMSRKADDLATLPAAPAYAREGKIWSVPTPAPAPAPLPATRGS